MVTILSLCTQSQQKYPVLKSMSLSYSVNIIIK